MLIDTSLILVCSEIIGNENALVLAIYIGHWEEVGTQHARLWLLFHP